MSDNTVLTRVEIDCATGQERHIPLTPEELDSLAAMAAEADARAAAEEAAAAEKAAKRAAVLEALATAAGLEVSDVEAALA